MRGRNSVIGRARRAGRDARRAKCPFAKKLSRGIRGIFRNRRNG